MPLNEYEFPQQKISNVQAQLERLIEKNYYLHKVYCRHTRTHTHSLSLCLSDAECERCVQILRTGICLPLAQGNPCVSSFIRLFIHHPQVMSYHRGILCVNIPVIACACALIDFSRIFSTCTIWICRRSPSPSASPSRPRSTSVSLSLSSSPSRLSFLPLLLDWQDLDAGSKAIKRRRGGSGFGDASKKFKGKLGVFSALNPQGKRPPGDKRQFI